MKKLHFRAKLNLSMFLESEVFENSLGNKKCFRFNKFFRNHTCIISETSNYNEIIHVVKLIIRLRTLLLYNIIMINYEGYKFGNLLIMKFSHKIKSRCYWLMKCDCGTEKAININDVRHGKINSCGCIHKKQLVKRNKDNTIHGYFGTKTYASWSRMIGRCYNIKDKNYPNYGQRGITVCDSWRESFISFLNAMGERPNNTSLDRINNNGNYEPNNCKWSTPKEQARNRRSNRIIKYNNKSKTLAEWSEILNIKQSTIDKRIKKYGWSVNKALSTKTNKYENHIS